MIDYAQCHRFLIRHVEQLINEMIAYLPEMSHERETELRYTVRYAIERVAFVIGNRHDRPTSWFQPTRAQKNMLTDEVCNLLLQSMKEIFLLNPLRGDQEELILTTTKNIFPYLRGDHKPQDTRATDRCHQHSQNILKLIKEGQRRIIITETKEGISSGLVLAQLGDLFREQEFNLDVRRHMVQIHACAGRHFMSGVKPSHRNQSNMVTKKQLLGDEHTIGEILAAKGGLLSIHNFHQMDWSAVLALVRVLNEGEVNYNFVGNRVRIPIDDVTVVLTAPPNTSAAKYLIEKQGFHSIAVDI